MSADIATNPKQASPIGSNLTEPYLWVSRHADYLYSYSMARLNDEEQAKDLVQETFLSALEKVGNFEGRSLERTWLTAILRNKIIDIYRKRSSALGDRSETRAISALPGEFFNEGDGHWDEAHRPKAFGIEDYDLLATKELNVILQKCMQKLPALWLSVFTMKHMDDAASATICRDLKLSASNFWVIIHRAKVNLRSCLQKKLDLIINSMKELHKDEVRRIAYNCRKATFLIEKKHLGKITIKEKFELKVHLATCAICKIFEEQSITINRMVKDLFNNTQSNEKVLDENFKKVMQQKIEEKLDRT